MSPLGTAVLVLGLAGAALFALALLLRDLFLGYPAPLVKGVLLSRKEQAIVSACADTLFPLGGPIPLSGTQAGVVAYVDRYIARVDRAQRLLLRLLLHAVEHAPWIFGPRRARFTRLSAEERIAALRAMSTSRIYLRRVMFLSLRLILTMAYLANEEVARRVGMVARSAPFEEAGAPSRPDLSPPREILA